jgi:hypothetical protein
MPNFTVTGRGMYSSTFLALNNFMSSFGFECQVVQGVRRVLVRVYCVPCSWLSELHSFSGGMND